MHEKTNEITQLVLKCAEKAKKETSAEPEPELTKPIKWPIDCIVGPGLEGAIACETKIGYVNGSKGWLIYRGYNIFDLCAYSTYEEVSYLLLHGNLPTSSQLEVFNKKLVEYRNVPNTKRMLMGFPIEEMNAMSALRLGTNLMRYKFTDVYRDEYTPELSQVISTDEDSIPMETKPRGEKHAIYEFKKRQAKKKTKDGWQPAIGYESCYHLIAGLASVAAAVARLRAGRLPIEPDPELSHAANYIYMITGRRPSLVQERIMDIALILHADHGMNASTFATMVVASTLSDIYLSIGAGVAALKGPLHGGANEKVIQMLREIGSVENVEPWFKKARAKKRKIMGFGHRVYKAYDPRARVLAPLIKYMFNDVPAKEKNENRKLFQIARALEKEVVSTLGEEKHIFTNVDFYSGLLYSCLGLPTDIFTTIFAVSRVAGWTARVQEYLKNNRIFRPRAMYVGSFGNEYLPIKKRAVRKAQVKP